MLFGSRQWSIGKKSHLNWRASFPAPLGKEEFERFAGACRGHAIKNRDFGGGPSLGQPMSTTAGKSCSARFRIRGQRLWVPAYYAKSLLRKSARKVLKEKTSKPPNQLKQEALHLLLYYFSPSCFQAHAGSGCVHCGLSLHDPWAAALKENRSADRALILPRANRINPSRVQRCFPKPVWKLWTGTSASTLRAVEAVPGIPEHGGPFQFFSQMPRSSMPLARPDAVGGVCRRHPRP